LVFYQYFVCTSSQSIAFGGILELPLQVLLGPIVSPPPQVSSVSTRDSEGPEDFGSAVFVAEEVRGGDTWLG